MDKDSIYILRKESEQSVTLSAELVMTQNMTPEFANAIKAQAEASVKVAEATHSKPAIQKTFRSLGKAILVVGALLSVAYIALEIVPKSMVHLVLIAVVIALGSIYSPEMIRAFRKKQ